MMNLISDTDSLQRLYEVSKAAGIAALDTEFVWERTYYPVLGLVQLGVGRDDNHLVDAPQVQNAEPFASLMADASVVKILHDAPQDLNIIYRFCGELPRNVFDTRLAASFAGMPGTLSLAALVENICGVVLDKSETRTNWLKRPLSDAQLDYAVDDVKYLPEIREILLERLTPQQKTWLDDDHSQLCHEDKFQEPDPALGWKRVKVSKDVPEAHRGVLVALAEWRETEARRRDLPRSFVIHDRFLVQLANLAPRTLGDLKDSMRQMPPQLRRHQLALSNCIQQGLDWTPPVREASRPRIDRSRLKEAGNVLRKLADERAREVGIDPMLLGSRKDLEAVLYRAAGAPENGIRLLKGWRRDLIGNELLEKAAEL